MSREDDPPCQRCWKPVHLQHDEPQPCGLVVCPDCPPCTCLVCKTQRRKREERFTADAKAEREMFARGEYDPVADGLCRPEAEATLYAYGLPDFCSTHNRYHDCQGA